MGNEQKHTPAPWLIRAPDNGIYDTDDDIANVVARGPYGLITIAEEVDVADARLIAAAPALLEALRGMVEHMEWSTVQGRKAYAAAKAAIAKARRAADMSEPSDANELITRLSQLAAYDPDCYDLYAVSAGALSHMRAVNAELLAVLTDLAREYELWAYHFDNDDGTADALIARARAALAKAWGE